MKLNITSKKKPLIDRSAIKRGNTFILKDDRIVRVLRLQNTAAAPDAEKDRYMVIEIGKPYTESCIMHNSPTGPIIKFINENEAKIVNISMKSAHVHVNGGIQVDFELDRIQSLSIDVPKSLQANSIFSHKDGTFRHQNGQFYMLIAHNNEKKYSILNLHTWQLLSHATNKSKSETLDLFYSMKYQPCEITIDITI